MLMFPTLGIEPCTVGGGATTLALGAVIARRPETALDPGPHPVALRVGDRGARLEPQRVQRPRVSISNDT